MTARTKNNITMKDVCFQVPKVNQKMLKFMLSESEKDPDPSTDMQPALYCSFVETLKDRCYSKSILELWDFNMKEINALTQEDLITKINYYDRNMIFGKLLSYEQLLGGIVRNVTGHIVGAKAIENYWLLSLNFSSVDMDKSHNMVGSGDWSVGDTEDWELTYLEIVQNISKSDKTVHYFASKSFSDVTNDAIFNDMGKLFVGVVIMAIYVQIVISKYNWVEARILLASFGLLVILMGFIAGAGICSLLGIPYGPIHLSLPFLLMGLGVDDMLVIVTCWEELPEESRKLSLPERVGLMLKHAGVSITITSVTDVVAFIIGASTILPCLESFCIYAAVSVLITFIFVITFFVACFVLDEKRIEQRRNGAFPWILHQEYSSPKCFRQNLTGKIFNYIYSNYILTTTGKICVIGTTILLAGFSAYHAMQLEQRFDPTWLIPQNSYLDEYMKVREKYLPHVGFDAGFYMGQINYTHELIRIQQLVEEIQEMNDIADYILSWVHPFRTFVLINFHHDVYQEPLDEERFSIFLSKFLHSPRYAKYQGNFVFESPLECGAAVPKIIMSSIDFNIVKLPNPHDNIRSMHRLQAVAEHANFTTGDKFATVWSKVFAMWTIDEHIDVEVIRNLQLALICVMGCTILMVANWRICFLIFICVLLTMLNVCGFMYLWGVTLELVSCVGLELAIGLCVDYATHIGHTFLTLPEGTKQDRATKTVSTIGSAVLYGGLSTFIGVFMLGTSTNYTFLSFFKIFSLVIIFGLYHGIVFFPVVLSWIGPKPYKSSFHPIPQIEEETKIDLEDTENTISK